MKRRFTILTAALALLAFLAIPMGMRGQTSDNVTLTKTMNTVVTENSYTVSSGNTIGDIVTSITLDNEITMSTSGNPNCGTFWGTTTIDWRLYQNQGGDVTITASNATLVSVKFTYNKNNNGTLLNGSTNVESGTIVSASGQSITLTVGNTANNNNGQVRITEVEVVYTPAGATPTPSVTVTPATIDAPAEGEDGTLAITYENITEIISFDYYFCDADGDELEDTDPDYPGDWIYAEINEENDAYILSYIIDANDGAARTAYIKVFTYDDNVEEVYAIVTVNQAQYVVDYATLPFSFDGGRADIANTSGLTQDGLDSDYGSSPKLKFNSTGDVVILKFNERPGILTFDIKGNSFSGGTFTVQASEDGVTYTNLKTYTELGDTQSEEFTNLGENVRYIKWIYTEKVSGNVALGNIALAKYVAPQPYELTVTLSDNVSAIFVFDVTNDTDPLIEDGAAGTVQVLSGTEIMISPDVAEGYVLETLMVGSENVISQLDESGAYIFTMPASNVTITATAVADVPPTPGEKYVKVTSTDDLTSGQYLIVYEEGSVAFDGSLTTLDAANNTIGVLLNNGEIDVTTATAASEFTIDMTAGTIKSASGYYIGRTGDSNGMNASKTEAYTNSISIDNEGNAVVVASGGAYLRFNNANNEKRFRYFKSTTYTGQKAIQLYKKVEPTPAGNTITVNGYVNTDGGYVLLAWPENTLPADIEGMISDNLGTDVTPEYSTYDLYSYDGSQEKEWRNYRKSNFNLVPGKGYLYASKAGVTLTYEGDANPEFDDVELSYVADNTTESLYLAGNSKTTTETFYVYDEELNQITFNYLVMNADGSGFTSGQDTSFVAQPLQGFFVQAPGASTTLSTTDLSKAGGVSLLNVQVMRNRGTVVDNAIVSFSNGPTMKKFTLFENSTKLYIPQDDEDYAIVRSEAQGELPVSFRAAENGTYTLSMNVENIDMNYLHLIDNMTGMDIDLLQTPSYTFEANTNDYVNRFKLVFAANGTEETDEASFAFFSDGNLIVNNEGNATLQVIDVNGRILSSETISGSCSKAINATTGVYMLRLINGDNVKVQKVVVR